MKARGFKMAVLFPMIFIIPFMIVLGGCASTSADRPDYEKIQQDSDKSMQDLKKEEDRHGGNGY
jgi:hypothetical protein